MRQLAGRTGLEVVLQVQLYVDTNPRGLARPSFVAPGMVGGKNSRERSVPRLQVVAACRFQVKDYEPSLARTGWHVLAWLCVVRADEW